MLNKASNHLDHTSEDIVVAYVGGNCTTEERKEVEEHCAVCKDCRIKLIVMLEVCYGEESDETMKELEPLYEVGLQAAASVRKQFLEDCQNDIRASHKGSSSRELPL